MALNQAEFDALMETRDAAVSTKTVVHEIKAHVEDHEKRIRDLKTCQDKHMGAHLAWKVITGVITSVFLIVLSVLTTGWF